MSVKGRKIFEMKNTSDIFFNKSPSKKHVRNTSCENCHIDKIHENNVIKMNNLNLPLNISLSIEKVEQNHTRNNIRPFNNKWHATIDWSKENTEILFNHEIIQEKKNGGDPPPKKRIKCYFQDEVIEKTNKEKIRKKIIANEKQKIYNDSNLYKKFNVSSTLHRQTFYDEIFNKIPRSTFF